MMLVKNYVAASDVHGVGLFAGEDVRAGERIYEHHTAVDLTMTREQVSKIGREFLRFMGVYSYSERPGEVVISLDNSRFMNHAAEPNTAWDKEHGWATRDIKRGEEMTCDYGAFWVGYEPVDPQA